MGVGTVCGMKKPLVHNVDKGFLKVRHRPTLPPFTAVPSALAGLTSLFGMGRGGHRRYRHLDIFSADFEKWGGSRSGDMSPVFFLRSFQLSNNDILLKEDIV